jgi:uncharacterized C2H2 Zn-finger protein
MSDNVHWPYKIIDRNTGEFMYWGCEGCNNVFPNKVEFNRHIRGEIGTQSTGVFRI